MWSPRSFEHSRSSRSRCSHPAEGRMADHGCLLYCTGSSWVSLGESEDATVVAEAHKWLRAYNQLDIRAVVWRAAPIPMRSRSAHLRGADCTFANFSRTTGSRRYLLFASKPGRPYRSTNSCSPAGPSACDRRSVVVGPGRCPLRRGATTPRTC